MDHARRTGDAFPRSELAGQPAAAFVLDEDVEIALQHEKNLLDFVGVGGVALARRAEDDAEGEGARRDHAGVVVLAGAAGADEAVLGAAIAFDLGVLERLPIRHLVAEAADISVGDLVERQGGDLRRHRVAGGRHSANSYRALAKD